MTRYYISNPEAEKGFEELTEAEWLGLFGEGENRTYANQVYRGEISIYDVPEENRATVETIVANKIAKFGKYSERTISDTEALNIIIGETV